MTRVLNGGIRRLLLRCTATQADARRTGHAEHAQLGLAAGREDDAAGALPSIYYET